MATMKVRCTKYYSAERYFTLGEIYTWRDNTLINNNGFEYNRGMVDGTDPTKWALRAWYGFEVVNKEKDYSETKIIITTDGVHTIAKMYEGEKVVKTGSAICSPEDKFDFGTGATYALSRLVNQEEKPEKEYLNGKFVCIYREPAERPRYTVGKVYEFVNGQTVNDDGEKVPSCPVETIEKFHKGRWATLVPLIEGGNKND